MHLGTARNLSAVQEDLHDLARLARAVRALQPTVSTTGPRAGRRRLLFRASSTALQRFRTLARFIHLAPMGATATHQLVVLHQSRTQRPAIAANTQHCCLGSGRVLPYSAYRGKKSMSRQALDDLKRQIPLLDYLQAHDWQPARQLSRGRLMGLCLLHSDHKPSFLVDPSKSLFYCYGCGRGGDVIRFAELYHQVKFPQALALLQQWRGLAPLLHQATSFYRMQLHRHTEAVAYLHQRGVRSPGLIEHMRMGYAPGGGGLRAWLMQSGYPLSALRQAGLVTSFGYDAYVHRIVFPLEGNLYGRSISASAPPHRFLPSPKGGLYAWEQARRYPEVILVEGLFDYAVVRQAGFHNVTCAMGTHLNARQWQQLCDAPRTVYLSFDADSNGSGPQASEQLAHRLEAYGILTRRIVLPAGHDPNSFFVQGGGAGQFQSFLEAAQP